MLVRNVSDMPVMDVSEVVELEQRIASEGTSLYALMKRAGAALADVTWEIAASKAAVPDAAGGRPRVVVLAGSGNNGGDGWVAASILVKRGARVALVTKKPADGIRAEPARTAADEACAQLAASRQAAETPSDGFASAAFASLEVIVNPDAFALGALLREADVVVDALLGTGFACSQVREPYASWIAAANKARLAGAVVVAADVPSGLNAQTGAAAEQCVQADVTVTMLAAKPGLVAPASRRYAGDLVLATLDV